MVNNIIANITKHIHTCHLIYLCQHVNKRSTNVIITNVNGTAIKNNIFVVINLDGILTTYKYNHILTLRHVLHINWNG